MVLWSYALTVFLFLSLAGCKKEPDKSDGWVNPEYPPGNTACPPVSGITTTEAGKIAEEIFVEHYKKMTQAEQDCLEAAVSSFRKKSDATTSEDESNDLATMVGLMAGDGFTPNFLGTIVSTAVLKCENNPYALFNFGGFLRMTDKNKQAVTVLQQAAKLCPSSAPILSSYGCALFDDGDITGAEEQFNKAIKIDPDCPFALEGRLAVKVKKSSNAKDDLVPLFGNDDDLAPLCASYSPKIDKDTKKKIEEAIQKATDNQIKTKSVDDIINDDFKNWCSPIKLVDRFYKKEATHIPQRPRAPFYKEGYQEQYVGSDEMIGNVLSAFTFQAVGCVSETGAEYMAATMNWQNLRPKSRKGKVVYGMGNIEMAHQIIVGHIKAELNGMKQVSSSDIHDWLGRKGFFENKTYAETESDFKGNLKAHNGVFDFVDLLLDMYYASTQVYFERLKLKCDYEVFDKLRRNTAAFALFDHCAARIPYYLKRENREPQMWLEGSVFSRDYKLPEPVPFKGCKETNYHENIMLVDNESGQFLEFSSTYTVSCEGIEKDYKLKIEKNNLEKDIPREAKNNIYKPFRTFKPYGKAVPRGLNEDADEVIFLSYNKDFGEATIGTKAQIIVPGSKYENMVGIFCSVEIK